MLSKKERNRYFGIEKIKYYLYRELCNIRIFGRSFLMLIVSFSNIFLYLMVFLVCYWMRKLSIDGLGNVEDNVIEEIREYKD